MFLQNLNLNQLLVFQSVAEHRSMTLAAKELHLTQSGVSQHIKSLEEIIGVKLLDRVNKRLILTAEGSELYQSCQRHFQGVEDSLLLLMKNEGEVKGTVAVGMPIEFGNNVIIPLLSKFLKLYPKVSLKLTLDFAAEMNQKLLEGNLDFAFIDSFRMDKRVKTNVVYKETLELCMSQKKYQSYKKDGLLSTRMSKSAYEAIDYVAYHSGEPVLRMWFNHHLKSKNIRLKVKATVMDVQGIARLIVNDMGAGVLPGHLLRKLKNEGHDFYCFKGSKTLLRNKISLAHLANRTHSSAAKLLFEFLNTELKNQ